MIISNQNTTEYREWQARMKVQNPTLKFVTIQDFERFLKNTANQAESEQAILLAGNQREINWARENNMAVIGFCKPETELEHVPMVIWGLDEVDYEFCNRQYQRYHQLPWHILDTNRCSLREQTLNDLDRLYEIYQNPGITRYMEGLYQDKDQERAYLQDYIRIMYGFYELGLWLIIDQKTGKVIGRAGLTPAEFDDEDQLELGYVVAVEFQQQGYATEVCQAIQEYAKEHMPEMKINCLIQRENQPSILLATRLGLQWKETIERNGKKLERYCN